MRVILAILLALVAPALRAQTPGTSSGEVVEDSSHLANFDAAVRDSIAEHPLFLDNEFAFGGSLGSPGGLNAIAERYWGPIGIRAEVGALPFILAFFSGWQVNVGYVIKRSPHSLLELTGVFSRTYVTSFDDAGTWRTAYGLGISIDAGGFFFEVTAGHERTVDFYGYREELPTLINSWPLTFQLGYVH